MLTRLKSLISKEQPSRIVAAEVTGKREHTARQAYCRTCAVQPSEMVTTHYVTFRIDGGEQVELVVPGQEYGALCEGDSGMLSFQGTRFLSFERR